MAFLKINDWTIAIRKGGSYSVANAEDMTPAYDGTPRSIRNNHKRAWSFETATLDPLDAEALHGILTGQGDVFPFDSSLYSDKGEFPTGTPVAPITPSVDAQTPGVAIYDASSLQREAKFGDGSLWVGPSTTNLLSANQANADNAPSGYASNGAGVISGETTIKIQGNSSVKAVVPGGSNGGVRTTNITMAPLTTYTASVYILATTAVQIRFRITDGVNNVSNNIYTMLPNEWLRLEETFTTTAAADATARIVLRMIGGTGGTFYADNWQLEQKAYGTAWVDGGVTRTAPDLDYGDICGKSDNLTFAAWVRAPTAERVGANQVLFRTEEASPTFNNQVYFRRDSGTNNIRLFLERNDGVSSGGVTILNYSASPWDDEWHHVAFVLRGNDGTNPYAAIYFDGVLVVEETNAIYYPRLLNTQVACYVGHNNGNVPFDGQISEVQILPFAMSTDQIAALASRTVALPQYPALEAKGDFNPALDANPETVEGEVTDSNYNGLRFGGVWENNAQSLSFNLKSIRDI